MSPCFNSVMQTKAKIKETLMTSANIYHDDKVAHAESESPLSLYKNLRLFYLAVIDPLAITKNQQHPAFYAIDLTQNRHTVKNQCACLHQVFTYMYLKVTSICLLFIVNNFFKLRINNIIIGFVVLGLFCIPSITTSLGLSGLLS